MAESAIPSSRSLMLCAEKYDPETGRSSFPLCIGKEDNKAHVFRDWYRCRKDYEASYSRGWGSYSDSGKYSWFTSWREPFEHEEQPPELSGGLFSTDLPQIYYVARGSEMSSSKWDSLVELCKSIYKLDFVSGSKNAIAFDHNQNSLKIVDGYLCATCNLSSTANKKIQEELNERYGRSFYTGAVMLRTPVEYFTTENGYAMFSFANNLNFYPPDHDFSRYCVCAGICAYHGNSRYAFLDKNGDKSTTKVYFNIQMNYINSNFPTIVSSEILTKGACWSANDVSDSSGIGSLSGLGLPNEEVGQYSLVSYTRTLG